MKHSKDLQRLKVLNEKIDLTDDNFTTLAERMLVKLVTKKGEKDDEGGSYTFEDLGDMCCMRTRFPSNDEVSGSDGSEFEQDVERIEIYGDDGDDLNALIVTEVGEFDVDDFEREDIIDLIEYLESYK
jgi:hypothetical protein